MKGTRLYRDMQHRLLCNSVCSGSSHGIGFCWLWIGRTTRDGYPLINVRVGSKHVTRRAHAVSYEEFYGEPVPPGMELDHRCHNRACIAPDHLRAVTKRMNLANRRGYKPPK